MITVTDSEASGGRRDNAQMATSQILEGLSIPSIIPPISVCNDRSSNDKCDRWTPGFNDVIIPTIATEQRGPPSQPSSQPSRHRKSGGYSGSQVACTSQRILPAPSRTKFHPYLSIDKEDSLIPHSNKHAKDRDHHDRMNPARQQSLPVAHTAPISLQNNVPYCSYGTPGSGSDGGDANAKVARKSGIPTTHLEMTTQWLHDNFETCDSRISISREKFFHHYQEFAARTAQQLMNQASFGKLLRSLFHLSTRRLGVRGHSKYHYSGIKVRDNSPLQRIAQDLEVESMDFRLGEAVARGDVRAQEVGVNQVQSTSTSNSESSGSPPLMRNNICLSQVAVSSGPRTSAAVAIAPFVSPSILTSTLLPIDNLNEPLTNLRSSAPSMKNRRVSTANTSVSNMTHLLSTLKHPQWNSSSIYGKKSKAHPISDSDQYHHLESAQSASVPALLPPNSLLIPVLPFVRAMNRQTGSATEECAKFMASYQEHNQNMINVLFGKNPGNLPALNKTFWNTIVSNASPLLWNEDVLWDIVMADLAAYSTLLNELDKRPLYPSPEIVDRVGYFVSSVSNFTTRSNGEMNSVPTYVKEVRQAALVALKLAFNELSTFANILMKMEQTLKNDAKFNNLQNGWKSINFDKLRRSIRMILRFNPTKSRTTNRQMLNGKLGSGPARLKKRRGNLQAGSRETYQFMDNPTRTKSDRRSRTPGHELDATSELMSVSAFQNLTQHVFNPDLLNQVAAQPGLSDLLSSTNAFGTPPASQPSMPDVDGYTAGSDTDAETETDGEAQSTHRRSTGQKVKREKPVSDSETCQITETLVQAMECVFRRLLNERAGVDDYVQSLEAVLKKCIPERAGPMNDESFIERAKTVVAQFSFAMQQAIRQLSYQDTAIHVELWHEFSEFVEKVLLDLIRRRFLRNKAPWLETQTTAEIARRSNPALIAAFENQDYFTIVTHGCKHAQKAVNTAHWSQQQQQQQASISAQSEYTPTNFDHIPELLLLASNLDANFDSQAFLDEFNNAGGAATSTALSMHSAASSCATAAPPPPPPHPVAGFKTLQDPVLSLASSADSLLKDCDDLYNSANRLMQDQGGALKHQATARHHSAQMKHDHQFNMSNLNRHHPYSASLPEMNQHLSAPSEDIQLNLDSELLGISPEEDYIGCALKEAEMGLGLDGSTFFGNSGPSIVIQSNIGLAHPSTSSTNSNSLASFLDTMGTDNANAPKNAKYAAYAGTPTTTASQQCNDIFGMVPDRSSLSKIILPFRLSTT